MASSGAQRKYGDRLLRPVLGAVQSFASAATNVGSTNSTSQFAVPVGMTMQHSRKGYQSSTCSDRLRASSTSTPR